MPLHALPLHAAANHPHRTTRTAPPVPHRSSPITTTPSLNYPSTPHHFKPVAHSVLVYCHTGTDWVARVEVTLGIAKALLPTLQRAV